MDESHPLPEFIERIHQGDEVHLFREVLRAHQVILATFSRQVGMPAARLELMHQLAHAAPQGLGVMDLSRRLGVNAAAVTRQVQDMEKEGLVIRRPDERDGRRHYIRLTHEGLMLFKKIHDRSHLLERSLNEAVSPEEVATAARVVAALRRILEENR